MKISIITVCLNAEQLIIPTVASVMSQNYTEREYIILDGGSKDQTLQNIHPYTKSIRLISEPDQGIYDAMNKGISLSTGDFLYFLNAGDKFTDPNVLSRVSNFYLQNPKSDIIYANLDLDNDSKKWISNLNSYQGRIRNLRYLFSNMFCQQRAFIKRTLFDQIGHFDLTFKISADFDFIFKAYQQGYNFSYLDDKIAMIPLGGYSSIHIDKFFKERVRHLYKLKWWQGYWIIDQMWGALRRGSPLKFINQKLFQSQ